VKIPLPLRLEYDFAEDRAWCDHISYFGVTVGSVKGETANAKQMPQLNVSDAELEAFCKKYIAEASSVPSLTALWDAAQQHFSGKKVTRAGRVPGSGVGAVGK